MSNLNPYAEAYSPLNALWLAKAARLAYSDEATITKRLQDDSWEFPKFHFFDNNETQGFIIGNDDAIVVAFRGTQPDNLRDWMTDFKCALIKAEGLPGGVHRGFSTALNNIWNELITKINDFRDSGQPLLLTGHSLGAALATLAAAKLKNKGIPVTALYTFGSPRVGNTEFVKAYKAYKIPTYRFVNNNDVVTRVAPRSFGYDHLSTFLYFDMAGALFNDIRFWNKFLDTVKGSMDDFLKPGVSFLKDHDMGLYEQYVLKNIDKYFD